MEISPESGKRMDMIIRIEVVLPAPFGPMNPYSPPRGTARSRLSTATIRPNVLVTPVKLMAVSIDLSLTFLSNGFSLYCVPNR